MPFHVIFCVIDILIQEFTIGPTVISDVPLEADLGEK